MVRMTKILMVSNNANKVLEDSEVLSYAMFVTSGIKPVTGIARYTSTYLVRSDKMKILIAELDTKKIDFEVLSKHSIK